MFAGLVYQVYRVFPTTHRTSNKSEAHKPRVDVEAHELWRVRALHRTYNGELNMS